MVFDDYSFDDCRLIVFHHKISVKRYRSPRRYLYG
jgi:hypothetical protein